MSISHIQRLRSARRFTYSPTAPVATVAEGEAPPPPAPHPIYGAISFNLRRPAEVDLGTLARFDPTVVLAHIEGWEGVTEEHLYGKGIGNTSAVPYTADVASDWLRQDQAEILSQIYAALIQAATAWLQQRDATAKN